MGFLLVTYPTDLVHDVFALLLYFIFGLTFTMVGYLSDICIGRYKVIRYSMWIIFVSLVLSNVVILIGQYATKSRSLEIVKYIFAAVRSLGIVGLLANTAQFGIDQLVDSSSANITSYISWYVWTAYSASVINAISQQCFCRLYNSATSFFLLPLFFAIAIMFDFTLKKWLIVEPLSSNPFKLIYQVLKYAVKHKYPHLRSAFTYCEDQPYSRIDLGKTKYGGPFSTEQVEDVKTFFKLLPTILFFCLLAGEVYTISIPYKIRQFKKHGTNSCSDLAGCFKASLFEHAQAEIIFIFVPVLEFLIYPLLLKCRLCSNIGILRKLSFGTFLVLLSDLSLLALESGVTLMSVHNGQSQGGNGTCHFNPNNWDLIGGDYGHHSYVLLVSQVTSGVATYILFTGTLEFVCAQSPYSMKGLLIGLIFTLAILSISLSYSAIKLFQKLEVITGKNCGIWYYFANTIYTVLIMFLLAVTSKCYTYRKRDETLSNNQIFAVNYFTKYLPPRLKSEGGQLKTVDLLCQ